jgi:hypothetical protein
LNGDPTINANSCRHQGLVEKFCEMVGGFK